MWRLRTLRKAASCRWRSICGCKPPAVQRSRSRRCGSRPKLPNEWSLDERGMANGVGQRGWLHADRSLVGDATDDGDPGRIGDRDGAMAAELEPRDGAGAAR